MPNDHVLVAAIDTIIDALGAMGPDAGSHYEYSGVRRHFYDWPLEPDLRAPYVQVQLGDQIDVPTEANNRVHHRQTIEIAVHVAVRPTDDGDFDAITPALNTRADIHKAMFADRAAGVLTCAVLYLGGTVEHFGSERTEVVTITEGYELYHEFESGNMGAAA